MEFTWDVTLFIFLAQFLAYTVKWLIGFGNPLISAPLLSLRLDNTLITPGTLLPDLCVNTCIVWQNRKHFDWRRILPMLLAMMAGVIPGTWLLRFSMPWVVKTALGLVVAFLGLEMAVRKLRTARPSCRRENPAARYLAAFFSGVCSGLFGIGLFLVAYLQRTARDYEEFKGSICFLFWGENLFRLALYCGSGAGRCLSAILPDFRSGAAGFLRDCPPSLRTHPERHAGKTGHCAVYSGGRQHHRPLPAAARVAACRPSGC